MPGCSHIHFLGPYRALVYHYGESVVETYSLFNGELVLLDSEDPPFRVDGMVAVASLDGDLAAIYNPWHDGKACIWNPATSISEVQPLEHIDGNNSLFISADGRYVYAVAARRNSCRIVDLHNTQLHDRNMASGDTGDTEWRICVSADLSTVAVAEVTDDRIVAVTAYRVSDGFRTFRITPGCYLGRPISVTLGADGNLLLLCYEGGIQLWDRDSRIKTFDVGQKLLPSLEAATLAVDATYVIGLVYRGPSCWDKAIMVWSVQGSTPPVVIDVHWPQELSAYIHKLHIDEALDIYLVCEEWDDAAYVLQHRVWSAAPNELVQLRIVPRIPNERFTLHRNGWVTRFDDGSGTVERLCWIPPSRRPDYTDYNVRFRGHVLPLVSDSGEVSFFDLSTFEENAM